jgi:tetratricopeptide (TPR) repeat protein
MFAISDTNSLFASKNYLIIDDFQGMRSMMREMLKSFGAKHIDTATNGAEAITNLEKNKYDVVLCDYNLGVGKNGQQILEEAKHRDLIGLATAWLIVTAEKTSDLVIGAAEFMPDDYIIKPVNEATMRSRLEKVIARKDSLLDIEKTLRAKNYARTVALCDELLVANKTNATELLRIKTNTLMTMGKYDQAKQVFEQILAKRDIPWAKTGLGKVAFYSGDMDRARQLFREVIGDNPAYLEAHDWLAKSYEVTEELDEAQRVLARCTELSPNSVIRQKNLGEIAHKRGDLDTAENAFRKTIKLGEFSVHKTPIAYLGLAKICSDKENSIEALQILKNVHKEFDGPDTKLHAKVLEGMVYRKSGDFISAGKLSKEVAELVKQDKDILPPGVMVEAAQLFLETGNKEAAEELAQVIVKNNHENTKLLAQVNELYAQAGLQDEGKKIVETSRQEVVEANNRGVTLAKEGKLDEAIQVLRDARTMLPNNKRIMINLANVAVLAMRQGGRTDVLMQTARECLDRVSKLDPQEKWCSQFQTALDAIPA